jgi:hypothetical protein
MSDVMAVRRRPAEDRRMIHEEASERLAVVRAGARALRAELPRLSAATEALEVRGDPGAIAALLPRLRLKCGDHFPAAASLARELLGPGLASSVPVLVEQGELDARLARLEGLLPEAAAEPVRDDLWRESVELVRMLGCHLCRKENGLLPMLDVVAGGGPAPAGVPVASCGRR